jgi:hypothetical protein
MRMRSTERWIIAIEYYGILNGFLVVKYYGENVKYTIKIVILHKLPSFVY